MPSQTCLVTGGAGFIGCALSHRLAEKFSAYIVVDNLHPQVHKTSERPSRLHPAARLIVADVTLPDTWTALLDEFKPDVVVHLAAETGTGQSLVEASRHARVNVEGTTQMLDAFGRTGIVPSHIVLSSSRAVYGEGLWEAADGTRFQPGQRSHSQLERGEWDFPGAKSVPSRAATVPPAPTSVYGATKLAQEHIIQAWAAAYGASSSILRFQNVYGPGQSLNNAYTGIVCLFSRLARDGTPIPVYEDGVIVRDFVYIEDVADALDLAVSFPPSEPRLLDIGSGTATTIHTIARHIADLYKAPMPIVCGKYRDGDVRSASCDISDAIRQLGWQPKYSVQQGLEALKGWIDGELDT